MLIQEKLVKQSEEHVGDIKSLKLSDKKDELKQIDDIFPQKMMKDLISGNLKEIVNLVDIIKTDKLS